MAFVFWRRIQGNRGWRLTATIPLNNIDHPPYPNLPFANTDVPKLWDLSNGGKFTRGSSQGKKEGEAGLSWVNLMVHIVFFFLSFFLLQDFIMKLKSHLWAKLHIPQPLSVYKLEEVIHTPVSDDGSIESRRQHRLNNSLYTTISHLTPLSWRNPRQSPSRHDHNHEDDDDGKKESGKGVTMRVAITIALPSPEYPVHIKNNNGQQAENNNMDRQNMTDYCIGTYECPWH